jgi:DNA-binding NtrC family response regulator
MDHSVDRHLAPLLEVLDTACDGEPRWIVADASSHRHHSLRERLVNAARSRGYVPMGVEQFRRTRGEALDELRDRALFLIGSLETTTEDARAALTEAAARSAKPHVMLTFERRTARDTLVVHEARISYRPDDRQPHGGVRVDPDVARHLARAGRATEFERVGRHAAAERLLRDVAAALARRQAFEAAAQTLIRLAGLLIERGRPNDVDALCNEAASLAQRGSSASVAIVARTWQAVARTDAARLVEAESICRAALLSGQWSALQTQWTRAVLARILLCQARTPDEQSTNLVASPGDASDDPLWFACVAATRIKILLTIGQVFPAGQDARRLVEWARERDPLPHVIAHTAYLRWAVAAGDLTIAAAALQDVLACARAAHLPLRAARARLLWYDALVAASERAAAHRERGYLARVRRVAPPLLRRAIDGRLSVDLDAAMGQRRAVARSEARSAAGTGSAAAAHLLRMTHDEPNDAEAVRRVLEWVLEAQRPTRIDLQSCEAGPPTTLITIGGGLPTVLGGRALEAGIAITERANEGFEMALPIRHGQRLLGALVLRWPLDRRPGDIAGDVLDLAAHVIAPPFEGMLFEARVASQAAADVPELLGSSTAIEEVRHAIRRAASAPFAVLVEGESGSGKELVARAIHQLSARRQRRFCDVNCAALPDDLLDSELFGHARGAFTGAVAERPGLFEDANGGTLFLDEIPDLSARGQAKLLRAIQQQEVRRVGETFSRPVDVRLVTAANRDMRREAAEGRFRPDLLYRLDVIRIRVPALRERAEDIPTLAHHFWRTAAERVGTTARLAPGTIAALARYSWPGNVRELQNVIAALAVAAPTRGRVRDTLLPAAVAGAASVTSPKLDEARTQFERRWVQSALARAAGSRTRAAAELGLTRQGLLKTMGRLGIGSGSSRTLR